MQVLLAIANHVGDVAGISAHPWNTSWLAWKEKY